MGVSILTVLSLQSILHPFQLSTSVHSKQVAHHVSRVGAMLRLPEHLRSLSHRSPFCVHKDAVSYFRPAVVHVYVVMTTRRQAREPPLKIPDYL